MMRNSEQKVVGIIMIIIITIIIAIASVATIAVSINDHCDGVE